MSKKISKWLSWLLVFVFVFNNFPAGVIANAADKKEVRVIIKNETFTKADGADWDGVLIDKWVEINDSSTVMTVVSDVIKSEGYTITGAETGYITEINGLEEYEGGSMSGWMGTLNDWFTNEGISAYTVKNGKLQSGDEICFLYSCNWGADIGSDWSGTSTLLKELTFSDGILNQSFESNTFEYTLSIPEGVNEVLVTPTAVNKNFLVKAYKNSYTPTDNGSEYKRTQKIAVQSGDKLYIGVGNTNWPSMNSGQTETVYTINVKNASEIIEKPYFEQINVLTSAVDGWVTDETFSPEVLEYNLEIKKYSTSTLTLLGTTKYDAEKYNAAAYYKDVNGNDKEIEVLSGKMTMLTDIPFGQSKVNIVISDKTNSSNSTTYVFNLTRPYDTTASLKGMVIAPEGRELLDTLYLEKKEGTLFKLDENGEIGDSGMSAECNAYKAFVLDGLKRFSVTLTGKTSYVHIRISEDGKNFTEVTSGTNSPMYEFGDKSEKKLTVQTVSDEEYISNGFENAEEAGCTYTLTVVLADADISGAKILTADIEGGDWYPMFNSDTFSYGIVIENSAEMPNLSFTTKENARVMLGSNELLKDENEKYNLVLKTSAQSVKVIAENGVVNTYSFKAVKKSKYDVPDKVVDYLCINSQYTNAGYGVEPMMTLSGSLKSLGNFGGYITYYYDEAITDNPNNKYGIDFYIYGNSFSKSAAESGQVWVSEDGKQWYALAGSEHYEDSTIKNYEITYTKTEDGRTAWTDNYGGFNDGSSKSGKWPLVKNYYLNDLAKADSITLRGILLPCADGSLYGDGTTNSYVANTHFGYVDYSINRTIGADVNPYAEAEGSNGFDLKWAVDENGNPIELENGIHYVKVVTASNIWAGAFNEKSTEVSSVVRTTAQEEKVGVTAAPKEIVIIDENGVKSVIELEEDKQLYDVKLNDVKKVNISVNGVNESDNIYINNNRIAYDENAEVTVSDDGKTVRIIIQNGEKEPVIYILNMESESVAKTQSIFEETTKAMLNGEIPIVNSIGGEWRVIGLARAERINEKFRTGYFKNAYEYVKANGSAKLHRVKSSDNSRMILALTSLGYDVKNVAGYNLLEPLADFEYVVKQGINGAIWALIAFDSSDYVIPVLNNEGIQSTRENIIGYILENQLEDGGFALDNKVSDADITAMAVQALTPYYNENQEVKNAVDRAIQLLSAMQNSDGSYGSENVSNAESTAQVIIALTGLKINPRTDTRFVKNGISVLSALNSFYIGDGAFVHGIGGENDEMATEQAYQAIVAYLRMNEEKTNLYDMSDVVTENNPVIEDNNQENNGDNDNQNSDNQNSDNQNSGSPNKDKENEVLPNTGDYTNVSFYVLIMLGTVLCIFVLRGRKRKSVY